MNISPHITKGARYTISATDRPHSVPGWRHSGCRRDRFYAPRHPRHRLPKKRLGCILFGSV